MMMTTSSAARTTLGKTQQRPPVIALASAFLFCFARSSADSVALAAAFRPDDDARPFGQRSRGACQIWSCQKCPPSEAPPGYTVGRSSHCSSIFNEIHTRTNTHTHAGPRDFFLIAIRSAENAGSNFLAKRKNELGLVNDARDERVSKSNAGCSTLGEILSANKRTNDVSRKWLIAPFETLLGRLFSAGLRNAKNIGLKQQANACSRTTWRSRVSSEHHKRKKPKLEEKRLDPSPGRANRS